MESSLTRAAIIDGARRMTHRELQQRAAQLAHALERRGVVRGSAVGIALEHSADAVVAMLACRFARHHDPRRSCRERLPADASVMLADTDAAARAAGEGLAATVDSARVGSIAQ